MFPRLANTKGEDEIEEKAMELLWASAKGFSDADMVAPLQYTKSFQSLHDAPIWRPMTAPSGAERSKAPPPPPLNPTKPLSPIFSPTGVDIVRETMKSNFKPTLKIHAAPTSLRKVRSSEGPPQVPPKSPAFSETKVSKQSFDSSLPSATLTSSDSATPKTPLTAFSTNGVSPNGGVRRDGQSLHSRTSSEASIIERGRPVKRSLKHKKSVSSSESARNISEASKLPDGVSPADAILKIPGMEQNVLRIQAGQQVEKFEVLRARDVSHLSKVSHTLIPENVHDD